MPPELVSVWDAFLLTLEPVERAKRAAVEAMPTSRLAGRPLAECLFDFEDGLREAGLAMPHWRHPTVEQEWLVCSEALREARRIAERLRTEAPELSFDAMAFAMQDLIAPLEAFEHAAVRWRSLRR